MSIVVKPKSASEKKKNDPQSNFARKWLEIEKKQKRNAATKAKIDKLYQRFQNELLPEEKKLTELLAQETRHLMSFMPRKSFTNWQREELHVWIESNLDILAGHPFANSEQTSDLRQEYAESLLKNVDKEASDEACDQEELDELRKICESMFNGEKSFSDEELVGFLRDPERFEQEFHEYVNARSDKADDNFNTNDFDDNNQDDESFFEDEFQSQQAEKEAKQQTKLKELFNSSKLNKLYKILANRLHPDKEMNTDLKEQKQQLMVQLANAKKQKDAFTIISMFYQHVDDKELSLFDGDDTELSNSLIRLLNNKIEQLEQENYKYKYSNDLSSMVWQKFNGRSKKATEENIAAYLADLEDEYRQLNYCINQVKTVKLLKKELAERYDQRRLNPFSNGGLSLDDLNDLFS